MSRLLVGSSSRSRFAPLTTISARLRRFLSPPERDLTFLKTSSPENRKAPRRSRASGASNPVASIASLGRLWSRRGGPTAGPGASTLLPGLTVPLWGRAPRWRGARSCSSQSIGTEQGHPLPALDNEVEAFQERLLSVIVGVAHVLHLEHDSPGPRGLPTEVEPDVLRSASRILYLLHPVEYFCLLLAWLALVALARFFSTKRSSCALRSALAFALRASCSLAGPFLGHVLAVVAGITVENAIFELQDRTGDGVEEVAVVGDDEDGASPP